jgi:membrane protease YdiL (CAAX protease family)
MHSPEEELAILTALQELLAETKALLSSSPADRRASVTLFTACLLLLVFGIWGRPGFFQAYLHADVARALGMSSGNEFFQLLPYLYWALTSVLVRIAIPCLVIWFVLHERPSSFGYRVRGITKHVWVYAGLFVLMVPIVIAASFAEGFQNKYPMYAQAILGWDHFALYQLAYGIQFLGVEAFFRGFLTFGLFERFGYYALLVMVIPYSMVHFGKPPAEVFAAVPAGLLLGYLALKTRSWVFGALLHWCVGISMDLAAVLQKGGFQG